MLSIFSNRKISILVILCLCLALRLSFFAAFQPWQPQTERLQVLGIGMDSSWTRLDALGYHQLADNLLKSQSFAYEENGRPDALRTPGYPLFVAAIYSVFGNVPWVVMLFQIALDTITCLILMLTLSRLFSPRVAIVSSLFYALDPFLVFSCSTLLSDILYVFLVVLAFSAFAAAHCSPPRGKANWYYALSGLLLGIATLVRPASLYIPLFITLFFFVCYWKNKKKAITLTVICLIPFYLAISPWLIRNYVTFDRLSLSTAGQYNLLFAWTAPVEMERLNIDHHSVVKLFDEEIEKEITRDGLDPHKLNPFQVADYHQKLAVRVIVKDPLTFAKYYVGGTVFNFINLNTEAFASHLHMKTAKLEKRWYGSMKDKLSDFISTKPPGAIVIGGLILFFLAITYGLSVAGLIMSWGRYDYRILIFLILMSSYFILVTGAIGGFRLKLPAIPFYICFAGMGFDYLCQRAVRRRNNYALNCNN